MTRGRAHPYMGRMALASNDVCRLVSNMMAERIPLRGSPVNLIAHFQLVSPSGRNLGRRQEPGDKWDFRSLTAPGVAAMKEGITFPGVCASTDQRPAACPPLWPGGYGVASNTHPAGGRAEVVAGGSAAVPMR